MKKTPLFLGVAVFLSTILLYLATAAPDVMFTDSGELAGACTTFGVAHPTGYPLFILLGNLFTKLPLGMTPIQALNTFVALLMAISAVVFMLVADVLLTYLRQISTGRLAALSTTTIQIISACAALTYATARTIWSQATSLEVYALHCLLLLSILYLFLQGVLNKNNRYLFASAFVLGLSFTNHLTTILFVPALVFLYFFQPKRKVALTKPMLITFALLILVTSSAAVLYLIPVLRSSGAAWFNWGEVHRSWDAFTYHVLGKQYHVFMTGKALAQNLPKFLALLPYQCAFAGLAFVVFGAIQLFRKAPQLAIFFILNAVLCFLYTMNYNIHDIESYFVLCFIALLLLMVVGIAEVVAYKQQLAVFLLALPVANTALNYTSNDISHHNLVPEYTKIITQDLPPNSILISQEWDYFISAFWYKQQIEGYRKDIILIDKELLRRTWYLGELIKWYPAIASSKPEIDAYMEELQKFENNLPYNPVIIQQRFIAMLNSFVDRNYTMHPIYITPDILSREAGFADGYTLIINGLRYRLIANGDTTPVPDPTMDVTAFAKSAQQYYTNIPKHKVGSLELDICENLIKGLGRQAQYLANNGKIQQAVPYLQSILSIDPTHPEALQMLQMLRDIK